MLACKGFSKYYILRWCVNCVKKKKKKDGVPIKMVLYICNKLLCTVALWTEIIVYRAQRIKYCT